MENAYECSVCGRQGVKLWRPSLNSGPLICARCAEQIQTEQTYPECTWHRMADGWVGFPTGRRFMLHRWYVDREGKVPSYSGPTPEGVPPYEKTDRLLINPKGIFDDYEDDEIFIHPAIPDGEGDFYNPDSAPDEAYRQWRDLPTK